MATKFLKCLPGMIPYILLFFLILLSIASITFGLVYDLHLDNCSYSRHQKAALWIYHFLLLFTIVSIDIVLFKLVLATLYVSYIWAPENLPPDDHERSCNDWNEYLELKKTHSVNYSRMCREYRKRGEKVTPFTSTFQSWFVLQWFIYFLAIFIDLTYYIRPWLGGGDVKYSFKIYQQHGYEYGYLSLCIVYDITVLIVPFICGIKMNKYHQNYYCNSKLVNAKKDQFDQFDFLDSRTFDFLDGTVAERDKGALEYALITRLKVEKEEEFDFTPSILGINIPLTNPGYILSIVIAMVTLILGVIVSSLDLSQPKP